LPIGGAEEARPDPAGGAAKPAEAGQADEAGEDGSQHW